jgi:hypothetical protein
VPSIIIDIKKFPFHFKNTKTDKKFYGKPLAAHLASNCGGSVG